MTTDFTDVFDRYFENSLSEKERRDFDLRLADDSEFSEAFAEYSVMYKAGESAEGGVIAKSVESIKSSVEDSDQGAEVMKFRTVRMLYAAAVVVVLVIIGVWAFIGQSTTPQSLYADYFEVYPGLSNTYGGSDLTVLWSSFSDSFAAKEYEACLIILGEVEFSDVGPDYLIHFYGGVCLMSIDKPEHNRALKEFEEVLMTDNDLHAQALWYQGLSYLYLGNLDRAREKLILLKQLSKYKSSEVKEILDHL